MALADITGVSNATLWNLARKEDPAFASHTAEATADLFTEKGFEALNRSDVNAVNDWFGVSLRIAFQMLNVAEARNPLSDIGLVEVFNTPNGGYVQRMALGAIKPVSPAYKGLQNGDAPDPFVVRKAPLTERFFEQNFDFQNLITYQDFNVKQIFVSEYGMGQVLAGILQGLQNSYTKQEYYNTLECLNAALNSTAHPMQDTQVINLASWTSTPTTDELKDFIRTMKNLARNMESVASSSKYNAARFDSIVRPDDFVCLVRPDILTEIELLNALNAPGSVSIPFEVRSVENYGGMVPYTIDASTGAADTQVQPIYDELGTCVAYVDASVTVNGPARLVNGKWVVNVTTGGATADTNQTVTDDEITWVDGNSDVLAVIAQRGAIFENAQNPYTVQTIYNPRGMYQNYWANRPNTAIVFDFYRNMIVVRKPA